MRTDRKTRRLTESLGLASTALGAGRHLPSVLRSKSGLALVYILSGVLAVALLIASVFGLIFGKSGLYDPYPVSLAGLMGQDGVTLLVGLPLLAFAAWLTRRGSVSGVLLWAGTLFYFAYTYYFYVTGGFNDLFFVYVAVVSASLYGLLSLLFALDPEAIRASFGPATPVRLVSVFLIVYSLLFAVMWAGRAAGYLVSGEPPDEVTHAVLGIDCAVLLPLMLFGGVWLWTGRAWGYVLGGLLLTKLTATGFTLAFTTALEAWSAGRIDGFNTFLLLLFSIMAVAGGILLVRYLHPENVGKTA